jgi:hypothetical protein
MNIVRYFTSPLTNAVYGILGWKYQEEPTPNLDVISIPDSEPGSTDLAEPKLTLKEFLKNNPDSDSDSDLDFDHKLLNPKNYNQKRKLQKPKKR